MQLLLRWSHAQKKTRGGLPSGRGEPDGLKGGCLGQAYLNGR